MKKDQNPVAQFLTCTSLFARQRKAAAEKRNERAANSSSLASNFRSDLYENRKQ
jgi:hypothetical protein